MFFEKLFPIHILRLIQPATGSSVGQYAQVQYFPLSPKRQHVTPPLLNICNPPEKP
jgi:hypothetical protein